jgi:hypothetical protein
VSRKGRKKKEEKEKSAINFGHGDGEMNGLKLL